MGQVIFFGLFSPKSDPESIRQQDLCSLLTILFCANLGADFCCHLIGILNHVTIVPTHL